MLLEVQQKHNTLEEIPEKAHQCQCIPEPDQSFAIANRIRYSVLCIGAG